MGNSKGSLSYLRITIDYFSRLIFIGIGRDIYNGMARTLGETEDIWAPGG
ncbi:MAG: hypothetical protein JSV56_05645 [Methanomassiliicoccales archaeon]|nr:MAG: hypothetical protein JSV56_05645 [Methanomassiliicoccales archaeon]